MDMNVVGQVRRRHINSLEGIIDINCKIKVEYLVNYTTRTRYYFSRQVVLDWGKRNVVFVIDI